MSNQELSVATEAPCNPPERLEAIPRRPRIRRRRRIRLPILLFVATCLSTLLVGSLISTPSGIGLDIVSGLKYAASLMTILICHEMGHFLQARRHGVHSSFPYFLPMPIGPLGTLGAVISMDSHIPNRRALFDIGISGPLAGLVPTILFCTLGLYWSEGYVVGRDTFGDPLLLSWIAHYVIGPQPAGQVIVLNPLLFAGWVGLLLTAVNLMPIGQLDGGHVLYALLRTRAHLVARLLIFGAAVAVVLSHYYIWVLMLVLLMLMGPDHPPTADDREPIGPVRTVIGWLTMAFIPIAFTPTPIL